MVVCELRKPVGFVCVSCVLRGAGRLPKKQLAQPAARTPGSKARGRIRSFEGGGGNISAWRECRFLLTPAAEN